MKCFFIPLLISALSIISCSNSDSNTTTAPESNDLEWVAEQPNVWQFVSKAEMKTRSGSEFGYLASLNPNSNKLIVYLEGGGACFNADTCAENRSDFNEEDVEYYTENLNLNPFQLLSRNSQNNYFSEWNMIFVPYSTGDLHIGNNPDTDIPLGGPQDQMMVGASNFQEIMEDIVSYFGNQGIDEVLITGSSAGGFGSYFNCLPLLEAYPNAESTVLIDAAPIFLEENQMDSCLSTIWEQLFLFEYPTDYFTYANGTYDNNLEAIYEYLAHKYPNTHLGLFSHLQDDVIRYYFGYGAGNCDGNTEEISAMVFEEALLQLQSKFENELPNWKVYYTTGMGHTILGNSHYNNTVVNGVGFGDWLEDLTQGTATHVLP